MKLGNIQKAVEDTNCNIVSLKYICNNKKKLCEVDLPAHLLETDPEYIQNTFKLSFENALIFYDPFRSQPTISVFCHKIDNSEYQSYLKSAAKNLNFELAHLHLSFEIKSQNQLEGDVGDINANLRSEIMLALEQANISCLFHMKAEEGYEVLAIKTDQLIHVPDYILIAKYIIKNLALSYGFQASFNPPDNITKLIYLYDCKKNLFLYKALDIEIDYTIYNDIEKCILKFE